jgi:hypothetical protein
MLCHKANIGAGRRVNRIWAVQQMLDGRMKRVDLKIGAQYGSASGHSGANETFAVASAFTLSAPLAHLRRAAIRAIQLTGRRHDGATCYFVTRRHQLAACQPWASTRSARAPITGANSREYSNVR